MNIRDAVKVFQGTLEPEINRNAIRHIPLAWHADIFDCKIKYNGLIVCSFDEFYAEVDELSRQTTA